MKNSITQFQFPNTSLNATIVLMSPLMLDALEIIRLSSSEISLLKQKSIIHPLILPKQIQRQMQYSLCLTVKSTVLIVYKPVD